MESSLSMCLSLGRRMVCSNKGAEFGVMGGLGEGPDGMRKEGMGLVMRITSGEEGLVKD